MKTKFKNLFLRLLSYFVSIFDRIIKKDDHSIVFISYPDVSDNCLAFFLYLCEIGEHRKQKIIWLLRDPAKRDDSKQTIAQYIGDRETEKIILFGKNSVRGIYYYLRSKFVFFTHSIYNDVNIPPNHFVINLWHGMPLKNIGHLDNNKLIPRSTVTIATSKKYQTIMGQAFGMPTENVLICGQPRCDWMNNLIDVGEVLLGGKQYEKTILWLPTYRKSIVGDIRSDGLYQESLPVLSWQDLDELNEYCRNRNYFFIIKIHPLDGLNDHTFKVYSNIRILSSGDFFETKINLYSLLGSIDLLLTDYSSVYIDYLLTLKPFAYLIDDFDIYKESRGFVFENPQQFMPAPVIDSYADLLTFIEETFDQKDGYFNHRIEVLNELHEIQAGFSQNLYVTLRKRYGFCRETDK